YGLVPILIITSVAGFACLPQALAVVIATLFFLFVVVLVIAGFAVSKHKTIDAPMCEKHRHYWGWRGFWFTAPVLVLLIAVIGQGILIVRGAVSGGLYGLLLFVTILALVGWAATAAVIHHFSIRVVQIADAGVTLEGVSSEFAAALKTGPRPQSSGAKVE